MPSIVHQTNIGPGIVSGKGVRGKGAVGGRGGEGSIQLSNRFFGHSETGKLDEEMLSDR